MKKFMIVLLTAICLACLTAVACTDKNWYSLTIIADAGVTVESEVQSGAQVQAGYEVKFTLVLAENAIGEPEVTVNEKQLKADELGVYSFKVTENTTVIISGVSVPGACNIEFGVEVDTDEGKARGISDWVDIIDEEGKDLCKDGIEATSGDVIKFKVNVSIYYGECDYIVTAGSAILEPDADGYYSYTVTGKQTVLVKGLPTADELANENFAHRPALDADGNPIIAANGEALPEGLGTEDRPYLIKTALDLYYMSQYMSSTANQGSAIYAYYRLENDIDMKGEMLYVIGDQTNPGSAFAGTFDGNGHTIKNYYMTDTIHNISNDTYIHLRQVGLFGQASAAGIYNLNLENFEIRANAAAYSESVFVGAIAGFGVGVNISNCSVSGSITVDGDSNYFAYAGGIIGGQQSAFTDDNMRYYTLVQSCSSNVDIRCDSGFIYMAGGITGYLLTYEERTNAGILNCYSEGNITGALRVGGIAGLVSSYSSVKNCYATGKLSASSTIMPSDGTEEFSYAYAGGITGYAEYDSIISNCFFTGTTGARAAAGTKYGVAGHIAGGKDETGKTDLIHVNGALIYNCQAENTAVNSNYIKNTLGWSDADWTFGDGLPRINKEAASKSFTVTVKIGNDVKATLEIKDNYIPVSYWYYDAVLNEEKEGTLPEYLGTGSARTYGYYFDPERTQRVPFGFVFTDDIEIYAAYADYTEVTGVYYVENGGGKYFTLTDDGYLFYYDVALNCVSTYEYNGDYLILNNTFFAIAFASGEEFYSFKAEVEDGIISIYANSIFTISNPLKALKKYEGINFGTYFDADGVEYTFKAEGTGTRGTLNFTYEVSGNELIASDGTRGTLENGNVVSFGGKTLARYDVFKGVWEKSSTSYRKYTFDGNGNWTYIGFDSAETQRGTYVKDGANKILLDNGKTATYADGVITIDGVDYYSENSYVGTWILNLGTPVTISFEGIGQNGFGKVHVNYGTDYNELDLTYQADVNADGKVYITIFNYYEPYGYLTFDEQTNTLSGSFYRADRKTVVNNVNFCLYDDFKGTWSGNGLELSFNGLGAYDIAGSGELMNVYGTVTVNGDKINKIKYSFEYGTNRATFTFGNNTYNLEYNEAADVIYVSIEGGESFTLERL